MRCVFRAGAMVAALCVSLSGLSAEPLTLDRALSIARERAPVILGARIRIEEAEGQLRVATLRFPENPFLDAASGPRRSDGRRSTDLDLSLSQPLDFGRRRAARIGVAEAEVAHATAESSDAVRQLLRDVALAHTAALHAKGGLDLAVLSQRLAADSQAVAQRRLDAGDVTVLDVNLARSTAARAQADEQASAAALESAAGELRALLGLGAGDAVEVVGDLSTAAVPPLDDLLRTAMDRPDLRVLEAEIREAQAERRLAESLKLPELGAGVGYEREEGDQVFLGVVSLRFPLWNRGQGQRITAEARERRLRLELETHRRSISTRLGSAYEAYRKRAEAVRLLASQEPLLEENERLVARGYEEGEIGLAELLLVRREILESRASSLDRLLEAALAALELQASAGVLR